MLPGFVFLLSPLNHSSSVIAGWMKPFAAMKPVVSSGIYVLVRRDSSWITRISGKRKPFASLRTDLESLISVLDFRLRRVI